MEPEARGGVPIPEAWIGKRITFAGPHHLVGVLTEVNDRGVVISYTGTQRRTQEGFSPRGVFPKRGFPQEGFSPRGRGRDARSQVLPVGASSTTAVRRRRAGKRPDITALSSTFA